LYDRKNIHVTREDIFNHLWDSRNVYDDQITDHVSRLVGAFVNLGFEKTVVKKGIIKTVKKSNQNANLGGYIFYSKLVLLDYDYD
jgi:DNA-binding winged helix-turn-helix (wHTH) protein